MNFQLGDIFAILYAGNVIDDGVTFQFFSPGNGLMFVPVFKPGELDLQVSAAATPEPGTWLMLGAGLLAIGFAGRRRHGN